MSLSRVDIQTYLANTFETLAIETGQLLADSPSGFGPAIDYALRQTGTPQAGLATGTIPTESEDAGLKLAEYGALRRFASALATLAVDLRIDAPMVDKKRSQMMANIKTLLEMVTADLAALGYGASEWGLGRLNLDLLEPEGLEF